MKKRLVSFINNVINELNKVTWPEKKVLRITTGVIILFMMLFALYIGVIDVIFSKLIRQFLR